MEKSQNKTVHHCLWLWKITSLARKNTPKGLTQWKVSSDVCSNPQFKQKAGQSFGVGVLSIIWTWAWASALLPISLFLNGYNYILLLYTVVQFIYHKQVLYFPCQHQLYFAMTKLQKQGFELCIWFSLVWFDYFAGTLIMLVARSSLPPLLTYWNFPTILVYFLASKLSLCDSSDYLSFNWQWNGYVMCHESFVWYFSNGNTNSLIFAPCKFPADF